MFDSVLLEVAPAERRRRKLTLLATLAGEALLVAVLAAVPLLYLEALPGMSVHAEPISVPLGRAPELAADPAPLRGGAAHGPTVAGQAPTVRSNSTPLPPYGRPHSGPPGEAPPDVAHIGGSGCCGVFGGAPDGIVLPPQHVKGPAKLVLSRLEPGMILRQVEPVYPPQAKLIRVQGEVILHAVIGKDGAVESLRVVSGHPMLAPAALAAVQQWRFRPYVLNGSPVEVEARITVRFVLAG